MTKYNNRQRLLAVALALITIFSMLGISASAATAIEITKCDFSYVKTKTYTGSAIKPSVTVSYNGFKLTKGTDYSLSYKDNTAIGTGKITVTGKGKYTGSTTLKFSIKLGTPNLTASSVTTDTAKFTWSNIVGASKYLVYRKVADGSYSKIASVTSRSYTAKVTVGKTYYFYVLAYNSKGTAKSNVVKVIPKLAAPKVTATPKSTSSITLSWSKVSGAKGYKVYSYYGPTDEYTLIKTIKSASTLSFTQTDLTSATTYAYAVAACNAKGTGYKSDVIYAAPKPDQVTGLKAANIKGSSAVSLTWKETKRATGYNIYTYNTSSKTWTKVATATDNSIAITGLNGKTNYCFAVSAYKKTNSITATGAKSTKVSITTLAATPLDDFAKMINSGKFRINYSTKMGDNTINATSIVNEKTTAIKMDTSINGLSGKLNIVYYGAKKYGYAYCSALFFKAYQKVDETTAKENGLDADSQKAIFTPEMSAYTKVTKGTATVNGKKYTTYSFLTPDDSTTTCYFSGSTMKRMVTASNTITISSYTGSVSASDYKLPTSFPAGYTKYDNLASLLLEIAG